MGRRDKGESKTELCRFVILAQPRTGSNYLTSLLHSHPQILCHTEVFHPDRIWLQIGLKQAGVDLGTVAERDAAPRAFMRRIWRDAGDYRAVGFKLLSGQSRRVERMVLLDYGVRKIVLRRENRVAAYVSLERARRTGQWGKASRSQTGPAPPIAVDIAALKRYVYLYEKYYARLRRMLRWTGQPWLALTYESLSEPHTLRALQSFLRVDPVEADVLRSRFLQQRRRSLRERISNYAALADALRGSELYAELVAHDDAYTLDT